MGKLSCAAWQSTAVVLSPHLWNKRYPKAVKENCARIGHFVIWVCLRKGSSIFPLCRAFEGRYLSKIGWRLFYIFRYPCRGVAGVALWRTKFRGVISFSRHPVSLKVFPYHLHEHFPLYLFVCLFIVCLMVSALSQRMIAARHCRRACSCNCSPQVSSK